MGHQGHVAIAVEWRTVAALAAGAYGYGSIEALRIGKSDIGLRVHRLVSGTSLYLAEIAGAGILIAGASLESTARPLPPALSARPAVATILGGPLDAVECIAKNRS